MSIKIKRISIENFKPFKELSEEFGASNFIVFDGPNGFGKTSFYDAIEILFTGKIGRYNALSKDVVDRRHYIGGNPLLHTNSNGEDLMIKAELDKGGNPLFLMRKATFDALSAEVDFENFHMDLYVLDEFDDPNPKFVRREDETELLSGYFGDNYVSNFEHLNYIEQQENIRRLKSKDLDRKKAIAHLFNTADFNERIDRLKGAKKKLRSLCDSKAKTLLDIAKNELNERKEKFVEKGGETSYSRMISWKKLPWDQESMEFSEEQFLKWMGKEGLLIEIGFFVENHDVYKAVLRNRIIADLLADEALVLQYLQFWNFLEKEPEYGEKLKRQLAIEAFLRSYEKGPLSVIENNQEGIVADLVQILNTNQFDAEEYDQAIAGIKTVRGRANNLSRLLSETKESRRLFIEKFTLLVEEKGPDGECPLCGYDWESAEKLKSQFDAQASQLEKMISATGRELDDIIKKFQEVVFSPIKEIFEKYLKENPVNVEFIGSSPLC